MSERAGHEPLLLTVRDGRRGEIATAAVGLLWRRPTRCIPASAI